MVLQSDLLAVLKHEHCGCQESKVVKCYEFGGWVMVSTDLLESLHRKFSHTATIYGDTYCPIVHA